MFKTMLKASVAASVLLVAACGEKEQPEIDEAKQAQKAEMAEAMAPAKPTLGTFGIDLTARNESVKPGDDFFMYASGNWYDNFEMPADKSSYGAFAELHYASQDRVKAIIEEVAETGGEPGSPEQMVADLYNDYMNVAALDEAGLAPIDSILKSIEAIQSVEDLTVAFGRDHIGRYSTPIAGGGSINRTNPDEYLYAIGASGLHMPDRDYYLADTDKMKSNREAFVAHVAEILGFAGIEAEAAKAKAEAILALETKIAEQHWPREDRRNRDKTWNPQSVEELKAAWPGFDWDAYFAATEYDVKKLNVSHPSAMGPIIDLINNEDLQTWKDYLTYGAITAQASYLPEAVYAANFNFYGTTLNGQPEPQPRWRRAVGMLSGIESMGEAIGQIYVKKYFPESAKAQMDDLVKNLRVALDQRIQGLDWMTDATKERALEKLHAFNPKIAYPDQWTSYDGLEIKSGDLMGNMQRLRKFFHDRNVSELNGPTDRSRWYMAPQVVNAYYNPPFNEIVFPAAILQAPFFDPAADPAVNYGGIGAVIGHELGHGFDDQGSKVDARGIQENWWTDEDRAAFEARADMLVEQYNAYEALPDLFVNGRNSLGENIGDVGGLAMAYHAYKLSLNGEEAPVIDGLTGDQRFFLAWAQVWKVKFRDENLRQRVMAGTHAPGIFRALAVRNHDAWYEAFNVQPGDKLYLAPEERVRIW